MIAETYAIFRTFMECDLNFNKALECMRFVKFNSPLSDSVSCWAHKWQTIYWYSRRRRCWHGKRNEKYAWRYRLCTQQVMKSMPRIEDWYWPMSECIDKLNWNPAAASSTVPITAGVYNFSYALHTIFYFEVNYLGTHDSLPSGLWLMPAWISLISTLTVSAYN